MSIPDIKGYKLVKKLGKGAFGVVYKAIDTKVNKVRAIKIENKNKISRLDHERKIYELLINETGFPKIYKMLKTKKK